LLFFRDLCGGDGGRRNDSKKCGKVIGAGFCQDSLTQLYDFCQDTSPGKTLLECQTDAEKSAKAVGFVWDISNFGCSLLFDDKDSQFNVGALCPEGFSTGLSRFTGTGFPKSANSNEIYTCYSCDS
jgi:hypothetical protein